MTAPALVPRQKKYAPYTNESHTQVVRETCGMAKRRNNAFKNARRRKLKPYEKLIDYWWDLVHEAVWESPEQRAQVLNGLRDSAWFLVWVLDDIIDIATEGRTK